MIKFINDLDTDFKNLWSRIFVFAFEEILIINVKAKSNATLPHGITLFPNHFEFCNTKGATKPYIDELNTGINICNYAPRNLGE